MSRMLAAIAVSLFVLGWGVSCGDQEPKRASAVPAKQGTAETLYVRASGMVQKLGIT